MTTTVSHEPLLTDQSVCASAPGKLILFGEHAVVYGQPAIAAALSDLRIAVVITPTTDAKLRMVMPDLEVDFSVATSSLRGIALEAPPTHACALLLDDILKRAQQERDGHESSGPLDDLLSSTLTPVLYLVHHLAPRRILLEASSGLEVWVRSINLPVGAGLGSSASFSVAVAAALLQLGNDNNGASRLAKGASVTPPPDVVDQINQFAYYSEILLHGTPSGIDNAVSSYGGAICFTKQTSAHEKHHHHVVEMDQLEVTMHLPLLLVHTHVPRSTKLLVRRVRNFFQSHEGVVQPLLDAMGAIATTVTDLVTTSSPETLAQGATSLLRLVRTNQHLLQAIGVSHPSLDRIVTLTDQIAGDACAAKLTGAGGGGCAMVLFRPDLPLEEVERVQKQLVSALEDASQTQPWSMKCFSSTVAGKGVLWMSPFDFPKQDPAKKSQPAEDKKETRAVVEVRSSKLLQVSALAATLSGIAAMALLRQVSKR